MFSCGGVPCYLRAVFLWWSTMLFASCFLVVEYHAVCELFSCGGVPCYLRAVFLWWSTMLFASCFLVVEYHAICELFSCGGVSCYLRAVFLWWSTMLFASQCDMLRAGAETIKLPLPSLCLRTKLSMMYTNLVVLVESNLHVAQIPMYSSLFGV